MLRFAPKLGAGTTFKGCRVLGFRFFSRLVLFSVLFPILQANADDLWSDIDSAAQKALAERAKSQPPRVSPASGRIVELNSKTMTKLLDVAPHESTTNPIEGDLIWLPMPDGIIQSFTFVESPIMEPGLAVEFPEIRTYTGQGVDDPGATMRFVWSPYGFSALILGNQPVAVETYYPDENYISYYLADDSKRAREFTCLTEDVDDKKLDTELPEKIVNGTQLKIYRLAVACTGEYANFFGAAAANIAPAVAAITTTINNVNAVYERDLSIRLELVANNGALISSCLSTDPLSANNDADLLLAEAQSVIDKVILPINYDVGHAFSTGAGGKAGAIGNVCVDGQKAQGVTGSASPTGATYDIDFVAHELGHQFSARHTFNSKNGCAAGTRDSNSPFEPGGGTTIMAYAGICGTDNVQSNSDPYFHGDSIARIVAYTSSGNGTCYVKPAQSTGNTPPSVEAGPGYTIPILTPFTLMANGSDTNGDIISYSWEEMDKGSALSLTDPDNGKSPLFRVFPAASLPASIPFRTFPRMSNVVSGMDTPDEKLPSLARKMKFAVVARDNHVGGGGIATDTTTITVNGAAGPFTVIDPNSAVLFPVGGKVNVKWDVAKTNEAPVNTANVAIKLSTDGGYTYPHVLLASTPNDGKQKVQLPNIETTSARIKVEAVSNIFWDISDADFTISAAFPTLSVSPTSVTLDKDNTQRTVVVSPVEPNPVLPLRWKATSSDSRITVSPKNGNGKAGTNVVIKTSSTSESFNSTVTFSNLDKPSDVQTVNVSVIKPAPPTPPHIKIDKTSLHLTAEDPGDRVTVSAEEANPEMPLRWKAVSNDDRVSVSPKKSDGSAGSSTNVTISATETNQFFDAEVTFSNLDNPDDTQTVNVTVGNLLDGGWVLCFHRRIHCPSPDWPYPEYPVSSISLLGIGGDRGSFCGSIDIFSRPDYFETIRVEPDDGSNGFYTYEVLTDRVIADPPSSCSIVAGPLSVSLQGSTVTISGGSWEYTGVLGSDGVVRGNAVYLDVDPEGNGCVCGDCSATFELVRGRPQL